jgi:hypothetical protein
VNQIKEQIKAIGDTVNGEEMVMTTLNDLPSSWDAFIQGICSRRKLPKFSRLWENCNQGEARMKSSEEKMIDDDQALSAHTRKGKRKKNPRHPRSFRRVEEITQISDVSIVRKWDTLLGIVPSFRDQGKRKEVKGIMFIHLKMMSHPRRLQRKMNQVMRSMFLSQPL